MNTLRQFRIYWLVLAATIVLACSSNAFAQRSYTIADQGALTETNNFGMVMGLNNEGWTENMDGLGKPPVLSLSTSVLSGRAVMNINGVNIDLGTLGGESENSWTNYGGINDRGEAVGMSETPVPDPDGEDFCGFHTQKTCRGFYWRDGHIFGLPTLGGNNAQAAAINNRGQIVGISETGAQDPGCPTNKIISPTLWERGEVRPLPTVDKDTIGFVQGINDRGQAVGSTGSCGNLAVHAVLWEDHTAVELKGLNGNTGNAAYAINDHGQAAGYVTSADRSTIVPSIWHDNGLTTLPILPGDGAAFATGINNRGQVVGSTFKSGSWSHGFIGQDGVVTDLNTLIPEDSNLCIVAASNINERGQVSGMATVVSGPDMGKVHAILLTPSHESIGGSMAATCQ
ncbi:MAG TPA: hypothetical protein VKB38_17455 [Terracidiphilus sp.]|nr:hypothetical protein [Terracidiphilus sp.]